MNGTEARLFISWKGEDLKYYTKKLHSYLLQRPEDFVNFRGHVRNIIDWGGDERLNEIRKALDELLEEGRLESSARFKSREAPRGDLASDRVQRRRITSTSTQAAPNWIWSQEYNQFYYVNAQGQFGG